MAIALGSSPTDAHAQDRSPPAIGNPAPEVTVLAEGLAIANPGRSERTVINSDPVASRIIAGDWAMPRKGDAVAFKGGPTSHWDLVKAGPDGGFTLPGRGAYLAIEVKSEDRKVQVLEASGHTTILVNGEPRVGDPYAYGYERLPIRLNRGSNILLFQAGRGRRVSARLAGPRSVAGLNPGDATTPDLVAGDPIDADAAIVVMNASAGWSEPLVIMSKLPGGREITSSVPRLPPLSVRKVGFRLEGNAPQGPGEVALEVRLGRRSGPTVETLDSAKLALRVREPDQARKLTFRSEIDGSVQYYGLVPAREPQGKALGATRPGLVLTLHGAAVEGIGQAEAYAPKSDLHLVAPTNRRPYGFDWEDWGRLDAIEVLDLAQRSLRTDPRRTYLTGHSMGGHGTWHLGVTFPDRFAAIAPSAGWVSMWSYAGARRSDKATPLEQLVARAGNPSDTLALAPNLAPRGVYILHGDADDNVPVGQARQMREVLGRFHPDFAYHEQPGAGHWWGSPCVDWPPLFAFLGQDTLPAIEDVRRVDLITMNPGVSATLHWATIEAQEKHLAPSAIHLNLDPARRKFSGKTENVSRLSLDVGHPLHGNDGPIEVDLDGQTLSDLSPAAENGSRRIRLSRKASRWMAIADPVPPSHKGPHRYGPFKDAFRHRFVLVYGTKGTEAENVWALARARYDAEVFGYRGNGSVDVVPDSAFLDPAREAEFRDRGVIVYGHSECNGAWPPLLAGSPVQVRRGQIRVGTHELPGDDLACLFLRPRPGSDRACVGVVAGTGMPGLRLTERLPYFVSGVAYPDVSVFSARALEKGDSALQAAGVFGIDWGVETGEFTFL
jgi:hypothetical protein